MTRVDSPEALRLRLPAADSARPPVASLAAALNSVIALLPSGPSFTVDDSPAENNNANALEILDFALID
jgi:hypothetical protein